MTTPARLCCAVLGMLTAAATASAGDSAATSIAVLDFEARGVAADEASILGDRFREELFKTGAFVVLERSAMEAVLKEQGFQQTGCVSTECAVEVGQLVGVRAMVAGSIGKLEDLYLVSARLISVQTGLIERTFSEEVQGSLTDVLKQALPSLAAKLAGHQTPAPLAKTEEPVRQEAPAAGMGRRVRWVLGVGVAYLPSRVSVTLDTIRTAGGDYPVNGTVDLRFGCGGAALHAGVLLKRNYLGLSLVYGAGAGRGRTMTKDTLTVEPEMTRQVGGGAFIWYYEPWYFRNRIFGISPGIALGYWHVTDELGPGAGIPAGSFRQTGARVAAPMLKLRFGRKRAVCTLEYGYTFGGTWSGNEKVAFTDNTAPAWTSYDFTVDDGPMHLLCLNVLFALGRHATWARELP